MISENNESFEKGFAENKLLVIDTASVPVLNIPGDGWLLSAGFSRQGPDLMLTGQGGEAVLVRGYFNAENPPSLMSESGAVLKSDLVIRLAGPLAPGQYAQATEGAIGEPIGRISTIDGAVKVERVDGTLEVVEVGDAVFQGDIVITSADGAIDIEFVDESIFSLGADGRMVLDEMIYDPLEQEGSFSISMVTGTFALISGNIAKMSPDAMVLDTPVATIGIRGTTIAGTVNGEGNDNSITLLPDPDGTVGEVVLSNPAGVVVISSVGATVFVSSANEAPSDPVILSNDEVAQRYGSTATNLPGASSLGAPPIEPAGDEAAPLSQAQLKQLGVINQQLADVINQGTQQQLQFEQLFEYAEASLGELFLGIDAFEPPPPSNKLLIEVAALTADFSSEAAQLLSIISAASAASSSASAAELAAATSKTSIQTKVLALGTSAGLDQSGSNTLSSAITSSLEAYGAASAIASSATGLVTAAAALLSQVGTDSPPSDDATTDLLAAVEAATLAAAEVATIINASISAMDTVVNSVIAAASGDSGNAAAKLIAAQAEVESSLQSTIADKAGLTVEQLNAAVDMIGTHVSVVDAKLVSARLAVVEEAVATGADVSSITNAFDQVRDIVGSASTSVTEAANTIKTTDFQTLIDKSTLALNAATKAKWYQDALEVDVPLGDLLGGMDASLTDEVTQTITEFNDANANSDGAVTAITASSNALKLGQEFIDNTLQDNVDAAQATATSAGNTLATARSLAETSANTLLQARASLAPKLLAEASANATNGILQAALLTAQGRNDEPLGDLFNAGLLGPLDAALSLNATISLGVTAESDAETAFKVAQDASDADPANLILSGEAAVAKQLLKNAEAKLSFANQLKGLFDDATAKVEVNADAAAVAAQDATVAADVAREAISGVEGGEQGVAADAQDALDAFIAASDASAEAQTALTAAEATLAIGEAVARAQVDVAILFTVTDAKLAAEAAGVNISEAAALAQEAVSHAEEGSVNAAAAHTAKGAIEVILTAAQASLAEASQLAEAAEASASLEYSGSDALAQVNTVLSYVDAAQASVDAVEAYLGQARAFANLADAIVDAQTGSSSLSVKLDASSVDDVPDGSVSQHDIVRMGAIDFLRTQAGNSKANASNAVANSDAKNAASQALEGVSGTETSLRAQKGVEAAASASAAIVDAEAAADDAASAATSANTAAALVAGALSAVETARQQALVMETGSSERDLAEQLVRNEAAVAQARIADVVSAVAAATEASARAGLAAQAAATAAVGFGEAVAELAEEALVFSSAAGVSSANAAQSLLSAEAAAAAAQGLANLQQAEILATEAGENARLAAKKAEEAAAEAGQAAADEAATDKAEADAAATALATKLAQEAVDASEDAVVQAAIAAQAAKDVDVIVAQTAAGAAQVAADVALAASDAAFEASLGAGDEAIVQTNIATLAATSAVTKAGEAAGSLEVAENALVAAESWVDGSAAADRASASIAAASASATAAQAAAAASAATDTATAAADAVVNLNITFASAEAVVNSLTKSVADIGTSLEAASDGDAGNTTTIEGVWIQALAQANSALLDAKEAKVAAQAAVNAGETAAETAQATATAAAAAASSAARVAAEAASQSGFTAAFETGAQGASQSLADDGLAQVIDVVNAANEAAENALTGTILETNAVGVAEGLTLQEGLDLLKAELELVTPNLEVSALQVLAADLKTDIAQAAIDAGNVILEAANKLGSSFSVVDGARASDGDVASAISAINAAAIAAAALDDLDTDETGDDKPEYDATTTALQTAQTAADDTQNSAVASVAATLTATDQSVTAVEASSDVADAQQAITLVLDDVTEALIAKITAASKDLLSEKAEALAAKQGALAALEEATSAEQTADARNNDALATEVAKDAARSSADIAAVAAVSASDSYDEAVDYEAAARDNAGDAQIAFDAAFPASDIDPQVYAAAEQANARAQAALARAVAALEVAKTAKGDAVLAAEEADTQADLAGDAFANVDLAKASAALASIKGDVSTASGQTSIVSAKSTAADLVEDPSDGTGYLAFGAEDEAALRTLLEDMGAAVAELILLADDARTAADVAAAAAYGSQVSLVDSPRVASDRSAAQAAADAAASAATTAGGVAQVDSITIGGHLDFDAALSPTGDVYSITIGGTVVTHTVTADEATGQDIESVRDALITSINNSAAGLTVIASAPTDSVDQIDLTSLFPGITFSASAVVTDVYNVASNNTIVQDTAVANSSGSTQTAQVDTVVLSGSVKVGDEFTITVNGVGVTYTAVSGDDLSEVRNGLVNLLNAVTSPVKVVVTAANGSSGAELTLTADVVGTGFKTVAIATDVDGDSGDNTAVVNETVANLEGADELASSAAQEASDEADNVASELSTVESARDAALVSVRASDILDVLEYAVDDDGDGDNTDTAEAAAAAEAAVSNAESAASEAADAAAAAITQLEIIFSGTATEGEISTAEVLLATAQGDAATAFDSAVAASTAASEAAEDALVALQAAADAANLGYDDTTATDINGDDTVDAFEIAYSAILSAANDIADPAAETADPNANDVAKDLVQDVRDVLTVAFTNARSAQNDAAAALEAKANAAAQKAVTLSGQEFADARDVANAAATTAAQETASAASKAATIAKDDALNAGGDAKVEAEAAMEATAGALNSAFDFVTKNQADIASSSALLSALEVVRDATDAALLAIQGGDGSNIADQILTVSDANSSDPIDAAVTAAAAAAGDADNDNTDFDDVLDGIVDALGAFQNGLSLAYDISSGIQANIDIATDSAASAASNLSIVSAELAKVTDGDDATLPNVSLAEATAIAAQGNADDAIDAADIARAQATAASQASAQALAGRSQFDQALEQARQAIAQATAQEAADSLPIADDDAKSVNEDTSGGIVLNVLLGDPDNVTDGVNDGADRRADGGVLKGAVLMSVGSATNGDVEILAQADTLVFDPTIAGDITVTINTAVARTDTGTGTVFTVTTAQDLVSAINGSSAVKDSVLATLVDDDVVLTSITEGVPFEAVISGTGTGLTITNDIVNGEARYTSNRNFNGEDSFTYTVSNDKGTEDGSVISQLAAAKVAITVDSVNDGPTGKSDVGTVVSTAGVNINVLRNDSDVDGDALSVTSLTPATSGTVTLNANGTLTYVADAETYKALGATDTVEDTFTYKVSDGTLVSDAVTVKVTIQGTNDAPIAVAKIGDDKYVGSEDIDITDTLEVVDPDTADIGNHLFEVAAGGDPVNGTLDINESTGAFTYKPNANYNGPDSFTYRVTDPSGLSSSATIKLDVGAVNDAPEATGDEASVIKGKDVVIRVLDNDFDLDGEDVSIVADSIVNSNLGLGTATINSDGTIVYVTNPTASIPKDQVLDDTFTYVITDGSTSPALTSTATVTVSITGTNSGPVVASGGATGSVDVGESITINALNSSVVSDPDGDTLTVLSPTQGGKGTVSFDAVTGEITYTASAQELDALADGVASTDTFSYTVADGNGQFESVPVTITITGVNDAPDAGDDFASVSEGSDALSIAVLGNDVDIDGDALTVSINKSGVSDLLGVSISLVEGQIVYDLGDRFNELSPSDAPRSDEITYTISDGIDEVTATVFVSVTGTNDGPVAGVVTVDQNAIADGVAITIDVLSGASDADASDTSETLFINSAVSASGATITLGGAGALLKYDPVNVAEFQALLPEQTTTDTITYTVRDAFGAISDPATFTVTVTGTNDDPIAVADAFDAFKKGALEVSGAVDGLLANDTDPEDNPLVVSSFDATSSKGASIVVNADGTFTYDPTGSSELQGLGVDETVRQIRSSILFVMKLVKAHQRGQLQLQFLAHWKLLK